MKSIEVDKDNNEKMYWEVKSISDKGVTIKKSDYSVLGEK